jgi:hypothetical protein
MRELEDEATKLTDSIRGKTVKVVRRHRSAEVLIEFDDCTPLFINAIPDRLEFSDAT